MIERLKEIWLDAKQMRDERGLTLIELLVVVVILGIIAAIAVVAIGGLIENSRKDAQVANAKQLISSAKLYVSAEPIKENTNTTVYYVGDPATTGGNVLSKYIDELNDPMNDDAAFKSASVKVTNTSGKLTYAVTLVSTDATAVTYFNDDSSPKRDDLAGK